MRGRHVIGTADVYDGDGMFVTLRRGIDRFYPYACISLYTVINANEWLSPKRQCLCWGWNAKDKKLNVCTTKRQFRYDWNRLSCISHYLLFLSLSVKNRFATSEVQKWATFRFRSHVEVHEDRYKKGRRTVPKRKIQREKWRMVMFDTLLKLSPVHFGHETGKRRKKAAGKRGLHAVPCPFCTEVPILSWLFWQDCFWCISSRRMYITRLQYIHLFVVSIQPLCLQ